MITEDCLLVNPDNADHCNADCLDTVLCTADYCNIGHHNANHHNSDPHVANHHSIEPHNADCCSHVHCDARSREPLLEGMTSEDNDLVTGTNAGGFEASNAGEENHLDYVTRSHAEKELVGAVCSAEPRSERSQCWADYSNE
jgi:hypothetical protein